MSTASTAVVDASRSALIELRLRRARANAVVVASDASCSGAVVVHINLAANGPLCSDGPGPAGTTVALDTRPIFETSVQPTLVLIAALADYAAALQKTVGEPNRDIAAELAGLAAKANEAGALANSLLGLGLPDPVKLLAADQGKSAVALAQFASDLAREAGKVRRVRAIVAEHDARVSEISKQLDQQVTRWIALARNDADTTTGRLRTVYDQQVRKGQSFEQRLAFIQMVQSSRADAEQVDARGAAMKAAVALLGKSRETLARHLSGDFDEAERRRIAAIERGRILEALRLLAQAATSFV